MKEERREIHTDDLARPAAAADRAVLERPPVAGGEITPRPGAERTALFIDPYNRTSSKSVA